MSNNNKYCGFVAIVGRPNVGKSTLLNNLIGEKISITANKPQTTRFNITGIKTIDNAQAVYIDTPGIHLWQKKAANQEMNKAAKSAFRDVNAIIMVVEALKWTEEDDMVLQYVKYSEAPCILAVNKVDMIEDKDELLPYIKEISAKHDFCEVIPISAYTGIQVNVLQNKIFNLLPEQEFYYPEDQVTDQSTEQRISEIVREKLTQSLGKELPYSINVEVEGMRQHERQLELNVLIWVERDSQKAIVIGKNGDMLKRIGRQARLELNRLLNARVHLQLWVKVKNVSGV